MFADVVPRGEQLLSFSVDGLGKEAQLSRDYWVLWLGP